MDNKADVKAIMARFQASGSSVDETSSTPTGRTKQPVHPTFSGPTGHPKKHVLESHSETATHVAPKPPFVKKEAAEAHEPNKTKALANRFANNQDDTNASSKPFGANKQIASKLPLSQAFENKGPVQKSPLNKPPLINSLSDPKPAFPKPPPATSSKPSWIKEDGGGGVASATTPTPSKMPPLQKPSSVLKLWQQNEEQAGANADAAKPSAVANATPKPVSNFRTAQNLFNKEDKNGQPESGGASKPFLAANSATPPPKPPAHKKPSVKRPPKTNLQDSNASDNTPAGPKRNPLPNSLALGAAPAKPNRPPKVDLENFKRRPEPSDDGPGALKKPTPPTPPAFHPSNHVSSAQNPSLPPGHPNLITQDIYDDVDGVNPDCPPPPPPGRPGLRAKEEVDDDDGEMYEDLDERWEVVEKQEKKNQEKEEKKRLEAEKKEQRERDKKEQDARKKFKLVGPLEVVHQGKAGVDCKGSKTDLALKQGDCLDIIRVHGNPEGKWLGRSQDGSIGYVKTTSVQIDYNSLKKNRQTQPEDEPEVYDDIDTVSDNSGGKAGVVLPPPPGEEGEIYDDVVDPNLDIRVPPPSQFSAEGKTDKPGAPIDEEIYDDVDSQTFPTPPPISSLPPLKAKSKIEEIDPKKQKKFEKEEKEFRKKFKYDGDIQVQYQVTINQTLTTKKWSGKDLTIKAGEKLDVIDKAMDNKLLCRNEDGKFGYVLRSYIMDDGDIYDDIGDDCIYDND
ncbi:FYN-binding protein 1 isoform X2 [Betta splendens]|uniref:FYN-binding protein 1 isoform X2 n=1 Tax=Betta splendens TaxID=158456 RepID=A0A6P7P5F7_BETSP|nr:FYN-binding protein 1 isoform X2 [Betta splendens]